VVLPRLGVSWRAGQSNVSSNGFGRAGAHAVDAASLNSAPTGSAAHRTGSRGKRRASRPGTLAADSRVQLAGHQERRVSQGFRFRRAVRTARGGGCLRHGGARAVASTPGDMFPLVTITRCSSFRLHFLAMSSAASQSSSSR